VFFFFFLVKRKVRAAMWLAVVAVGLLGLIFAFLFARSRVPPVNASIPEEIRRELVKKRMETFFRKTTDDPDGWKDLFQWGTVKGISLQLVQSLIRQVHYTGWRVGEKAIECRVVDLNGKHLSILETFMKPGRPLVLNFGSYT